MSNYNFSQQADQENWDNASGAVGTAYDDPNTADSYQGNYEQTRAYSTAGITSQGQDQYDNNGGGNGGWQVDEYGRSYYYDAEGRPVFEGADPNYYQSDQPWVDEGQQYNKTNQNAQQSTSVPMTKPVVPPIANYNQDTKQSWFCRVFNAIGSSVPWKLYMSFHFYAIFVLSSLLGFDFLYACIYRMYSLPNDNSPFWQTMAYFTILIALHFFIGSWLTLIKEYAVEYWNWTPQEEILWAMKNKSVRHSIIHALMFTLYIPLPFLWSIIYTAVQQRNVIYFIQWYFFITMVIMFWQLVVAYVWMYWRALVQKNNAFRRRKKFKVEKKEGREPQKVKASWYENPLVLKEYGMDMPSLSAMMIYTFTGFIIHIIISISMSIDGDIGPEQRNSPAYLAVGLGYFIYIYFVREMANSKRWYYSAWVCVSGIVVYLILALVGNGISGGGTIGVWIVLFVATQGLVLRKRDYYSREEPQPGDVCLVEDEEKSKNDSYMVCCQAGWRSCFGHVFEGLFGPAMTPVERQATNRIRKERRSLWSDIKLTNNYLLLFSGCLILLLVFGRLVRNVETQSIAVRGQRAIEPSRAPGLQAAGALAMCTWDAVNPFPDIQNSSKVGLQLMDIAFMTALTYSDGDRFDKDFKVWFGHNDNLTRMWPRSKVSNEADITGDDENAKFLDFYDSGSKTHVIIVRSFATMSSWMRDIDIWGESIVYQVGSIMVPFVSSWPDHMKTDFVRAMSFLKEWFGGNGVTDSIELYIDKKRQEGHTVILAGHGTNGGLAKIIAARKQARVVAFNAPGTKLLAKKWKMPDNFINEMTVSTERDFFSYVDETSGTQHWLPCPEGESETRCSSLPNLVSNLIVLCGDKYGREIKGLLTLTTQN